MIQILLLTKSQLFLTLKKGIHTNNKRTILTYENIKLVVCIKKYKAGRSLPLPLDYHCSIQVRCHCSRKIVFVNLYTLIPQKRSVLSLKIGLAIVKEIFFSINDKNYPHKPIRKREDSLRKWKCRNLDYES